MPFKVREKVCPVCTSRFKTRTATYCSRGCAEVAKGNRLKIKCQTCSTDFFVKKSRIDRGHGRFCSKECYDKSQINRINVVCSYCSKEFSILPHLLKRTKFCSNDCKTKAFMIEIPKEVLYDLYVVQDLTTREIGFILNRDKKVILDYIHRYGIEPKETGFKQNKKLKCADGHLVKSHYERALDNALHRHGIEHVYEPRLPFDKRYAADFLVKDVYIEIWGMAGWKRYNEKKERKLKLYRENNVKLFNIYPEDFRNIDKIISDLKALL